MAGPRMGFKKPMTLPWMGGNCCRANCFLAWE